MLDWLANASVTLRTNCVDDITANTEFLAASAAHSIGVVTALVPHIGYTAAAHIAKQALLGGVDVIDLVVALGVLTRDEVLRLISVEALTGTSVL
jgi:aspartate ammonia-lyase